MTLKSIWIFLFTVGCVFAADDIENISEPLRQLVLWASEDHNYQHFIPLAESGDITSQYVLAELFYYKRVSKQGDMWWDRAASNDLKFQAHPFHTEEVRRIVCG